MAPLVLSQLKNIEGPLEDLDPVLHTGFLMWSYGVSGLDLVPAIKINHRNHDDIHLLSSAASSLSS